MIGIKLNGRLGNQMFQYAFAFANSKRLLTKFSLDESEFSGKDLIEFFELKNYKMSGKRNLRNFFFNRNYKKNIIEVNHKNSFILNEELLKRNNCLYTGFFQSENYFRGYEDLIKKEFTIKEGYAINAYDNLNISRDKQIMALHVRRTDYIKYGSEILGGENLTLPLEYYNLCLQMIGDIENYHIVFVTDDPEYVEQHFHQFDPIISSSKSPIIDFQILQTADIVAVANSSFSWWGAYLNKNATRIFAPDYWSGFKVKREYPAEIIPVNWQRIQF